MSGVASGGQKLTPIKNVTARAGIGGSLWGANGGGITPIGGGVAGQTGWVVPLKANTSDGESDLNTTAFPASRDPRPVNAKASAGQMALDQSVAFIPGFAIPSVMLPGVQT
jgi:hypothetical protein